MAIGRLKMVMAGLIVLAMTALSTLGPIETGAVAAEPRGDAAATSEYAGRWGVFNLMAECGLTKDEALRVSDHLPVWAEFNVYEAGALRGGGRER